VHARGFPQVGGDDAGQLQIVGLRQADPDLLELGLEDVEVVKQPLGGRQDGFRVPDVRAERAVGAAEDADVIVKAGEESPGPAPRGSRRREARRQRFGERFKAFDAEELVAERAPIPKR
jgi:hypothetical protein